MVEALKEHDVRPGHVEGYKLGEWILIDYSDLVVHVFTRETRAFYALEKLWGDAPVMSLEQARSRGQARSAKKRGVSASRKG